jgi:hypothetical protein
MKCNRFGWEVGPLVCKACQAKQRERGDSIQCNGPAKDPPKKETILGLPEKSSRVAAIYLDKNTGYIYFNCYACEYRPEYPWVCGECQMEQEVKKGTKYKLSQRVLDEQREILERIKKYGRSKTRLEPIPDGGRNTEMVEFKERTTESTPLSERLPLY